MRGILKALKKNAFLIYSLLPAFLYIGFFAVIIGFYLLKLSLTKYVGGDEVLSPTLYNYISLEHNF